MTAPDGQRIPDGIPAYSRPFARKHGALAFCVWTFTFSRCLAVEGLPPIRGIHQPGFWEANWPWIIPAGVIGLLVLAFFVGWLIRRQPAVPPPTPLQKALDALERARGLQNHPDPRVFSAAVSDVLRHYLEEASGLRAPEQTTEEFLHAATGHPALQGDALDGLKDFLQLCDLAKFARHNLDQNERGVLLDTAGNFLREQAAASNETEPTSHPSTTP